MQRKGLVGDWEIKTQIDKTAKVNRIEIFLN